MNSVVDCVIVLAGGTGQVGEGMARAFLKAGATVIVPVRSDEKREELLRFIGDPQPGKLDTTAASVGQPAGAEKLRDYVIAKYGRVDIAVASLGGWYDGYDLADMPAERWDTLMQNNLTSHFIFSRTFIPLLREQDEGLYVNINGGAQDFIIPNAGGMTVISTAQNRMTEVLAREAEGHQYRVRSVAAYTPVKTRSRGKNVSPDWVSAEEMGEYILRLYRNDSGKDPVTHRLGVKEV